MRLVDPGLLVELEASCLAGQGVIVGYGSEEQTAQVLRLMTGRPRLAMLLQSLGADQAYGDAFQREFFAGPDDDR